MQETNDRSSYLAVGHEDFKELLTIDELAAQLKVPKSWIYTHTRARMNPRLPYIKLGKYLRFRLPEVYAYLERLRRS
jgi:excisionase family DNA binding protein